MKVFPKVAVLSAQDFIVIWQSATTLDEVVANTGMRRTTACARAAKYRALGITLRKFPNGCQMGACRAPALDIAALNALAKKSAAS